jgi:opacity protein-like surface antigen
MKRTLLLLATITMLAFTASAAAGPPVVNVTDVVKNGTDTFVDVNPCTGDLAEITITFNAVFHITIFANGTVHVTETTTGRFLLDTLDPSKPDFSGHFTQWDGFNGNNRNAAGTFTFTVNGTGTDGSHLRFHETAHFTVNANGVMTVEFDRPTCG